ncbi:MAG TPA: glycosyltransferase family 2 protein [Thermoanaerobaculia bacterium]
MNASSPPAPADVDAVVVNRDGGDALFRALSSLRDQREIGVSVVVVDNASGGAERQRLAALDPAPRVISFSRNLGFAGAANEGIARTGAPFVLLVNNDAVLSADYAARLSGALSADAGLAAVQGLVLSEDGTRIDSAGLEWNARGEAVPVLAGRPAGEAPAAPFPVTGVSATATMYRRTALEALEALREVEGGAAFDDSFFAYYEDVDLSLRLARAGWRFVCEPRAVARHEGSRTGRRTPFRRAFWTARNRWRTLFRNFDSALVARHLFPILRADLAHVRAVGWRGVALPLLVWPRVPFLALRERGGHGSPGKLSRFPAATP